MSRLDTIASISRWLSSGTTTSSACAGVTTPPTVCTASCCTTPSTGAVSTCSLVRCSALMTSWARPAAFCSALVSSSNRVRRYSAAVWARVSAKRRHRRVGFLVLALLHQNSCCRPMRSWYSVRYELGAQVLVIKIFTNVDLLRQNRDGRFELGDRRRDRFRVRLLLLHLAIDRSQFALVFGSLANKKLPIHLDQEGLAPSGGSKSSSRIASCPTTPRAAAPPRARPR